MSRGVHSREEAVMLGKKWNRRGQRPLCPLPPSFTSLNRAAERRSPSAGADGSAEADRTLCRSVADGICKKFISNSLSPTLF